MDHNTGVSNGETMNITIKEIYPKDPWAYTPYLPGHIFPSVELVNYTLGLIPNKYRGRLN